MTVIEQRTMDAIQSINRKMRNQNEPDWEQRRYEIAKDITCAYCVSIGVGNSSEFTEKKEIIEASVEMANMLVAELKKGAKQWTAIMPTVSGLVISTIPTSARTASDIFHSHSQQRVI